ncbi:CGNR zinc finger domain-containing protein [Streptomyces sp. NPDC005576]|uniref:CGNR zinc finger domain-containing protein n=1 Tax=unclassified Streptomyces TaxID=2593676 RepID=UPI0033F2534A
MTVHGKDPLEIRPDEPLAVEFTSSWRYESGVLVDEVNTPQGLTRWITAYRSRLAMSGGERIDIGIADIATALTTRNAVRDLLDSIVDNTPPPEASLGLVMRRARAIQEAELAWPASGPHLVWPEGTETMEKVTAQVCASTVRLSSSPRRLLLRRCPAPRCVLFFSALRKGQQWCSPACGNRARVARHSAKAR